MRRLMHVITPGDHFSPSTGSAIPTVVHGLSHFASEQTPRAAVLVARGTYPDRYQSADIIEYEAAPRLPLDRRLPQRHIDSGLAVLKLPRVLTRRVLAAAVAGQNGWPPSILVGHNAPQLVPLVDSSRHVPMLYAHNHPFRRYTRREAGRVLDRVALIVCVGEAQPCQSSQERSQSGKLPDQRSEVAESHFRPPHTRTGPHAPTALATLTYWSQPVRLDASSHANSPRSTKSEKTPRQAAAERRRAAR